MPLNLKSRAVLFAAAIAVCSVVKLPCAVAYSASYDQKITTRDQVIASKVLFKDDQFRIESVIQGMKAYVIKNSQGLFQYLPDQGIAMSLQGLMPAQTMVQHPENYAAYLKEHNAKLLRSETVDGKPCDVYQFDDTTARGQVTAWVWKEREFPVRLEIDGTEGIMTIEISNVLIGAGISDSVFKYLLALKWCQWGNLCRACRIL